MSTLNYKHTIFSCFLGFICQAIIVNFAPLLFLTFSHEFGIPLTEITLLVTVNFAVQLLTDILASKYADRIGYRPCLVVAHVLCSAGLVLMTFLPSLIGGLAGLLVPTVLYAVGGGLLEVLLSPVIESSPVENKTGALSLLHSFYCFGVVATGLLSTLYFTAFGTSSWRMLAIIWAAVPLINAVLMAVVPITTPPPVEKTGAGYKGLLSKPIFWVFLLMMTCSGAAEQAVLQWASAFTESTLGVDKTLGDVIGVAGFAAMMGIARALYGKYSEKIPPRKALLGCAVVCTASYLLITLTESNTVGLIGCVLVGLSVGILWPGSFSLATVSMPAVSTAMFGLLSVAGDLGCSLGPSTVGLFTEIFGGDMKMGILIAIAFPIIYIVSIFILGAFKKRENNRT